MKTIAYISASFALLPAIAALIKFRFASVPFKVISIYFFLCVITEIISAWLNLYSMNNSLLGDIFYITEGILLIGFYYFFYEEKEFLFPAIVIGIAYFSYGMYTSVIDPGPWVYNANFRAGESLMVQALSAYALIRISKEEGVKPMSNPGFLISAGFFIYFSVNIVVFITGSVLFENNVYLMKSTWFIHSFTNIIANVLFAYGLTCIPSSQSR